MLKRTPKAGDIWKLEERNGNLHFLLLEKDARYANQEVVSHMAWTVICLETGCIHLEMVYPAYPRWERVG